MEKTCRVCGCTHNRACCHPELGNCWWAEPDLCSHCAMIESGQIEKEDVTHLCPDTSCVYHECMGGECKYEEMKKNGVDSFERNCKRLK